MNINTVILAAGKGTRMCSQLPKVLHQIASKPLLQHVYETSRRLVDNQIYVVVGYGAEQVQSRLQWFDAIWVNQTTQLGTGHAVQQVSDLISDHSTVLILYGDVPLLSLATMETMIAGVNNEEMSLLTTMLENPYGYGRIVRDVNGRVMSIVEEKDASSDEIKKINEVNTGIMAVESSNLKRWLAQLTNNNAQGEYYLTDIIAMAVTDGVKISTYQPVMADEVMGVNDRSQLAYLERVYQKQQVLSIMSRGVTLKDTARFDLRGEFTHLGQDIEIDINVIIEGKVSLGNRVKIGPGSIIKNSIIGDDTEIFAMTVIEDAVIGEGCKVGPFARLRPDTVLGNEVHIGNYVELKKSTIAEGTKINHLSYVGDAQVGSRVNIGAGTITCNYDGANKFQTIIGDGAFIGSDTQLIAPVTVGAYATIGAGSTITKNTPEGQLTLSRAVQVSVPGWLRPKKKEAD